MGGVGGIKPLDTNRINYLNIGLMVLSAGFAWVWPFETFLFAYTLLGPLHYLTEISWLHERGYYTNGKNDYLYLIAAALLLTVTSLDLIPGIPKYLPPWSAFAAFSAALAFVILKTPMARWTMVVLLAAAGWLIGPAPWFFILFGVFLTTLIHVFLFTGLFILAGALKGRSLSGFLSLGVFVLIALSFIFIHLGHAGYQVGNYVADNYGTVREDGSLSSPFLAVNFYFSKIFGLSGFPTSVASIKDFAWAMNGYLYHHPVSLSLMSFIAFAYLYHYFNWFSKTSIIGWHQVSKVRLAVIGAIWSLSVGLYAFNYGVGLRWLLFLSLAHVLLEFPLNHRTLIQVAKELGGRMKPLHNGGSLKERGTGARAQ